MGCPRRRGSGRAEIGDDVLRKIDCVMVRVDDLERARCFYVERLGLSERWRDDSQPSIGMGFPDSDAELVLHTMDLPFRIEVTYLVDDVVASINELKAQGVQVVREPFEIPIGKCAVFNDPSGNEVSILDMTKGPRAPMSRA
jgi:lactoylglutathione lyase